MVDTDKFERLLEALDDEIEEIDEGSTKENLKDISNALYGIYEDVSCMCYQHETLKDSDDENAILKELLKPYLSDSDKLYYSIKYGIDWGI